jgi:hypothetical protein
VSWSQPRHDHHVALRLQRSSAVAR